VRSISGKPGIQYEVRSNRTGRKTDHIGRITFFLFLQKARPKT